MLHLPGHICPACEGVHRPSPHEKLAAAIIRPYFATYTPSKFPAGSGNTPLEYSSTFSLPGSNGAATGFAAAAQPITVVSSNVLTMGRTGQYAVSIRVDMASGVNNGLVGSYTMAFTGGASDTGNLTKTIDAENLGIRRRQVFNAGDTITVTGSDDASRSNTKTIFVTFIPTPSNPQ